MDLPKPYMVRTQPGSTPYLVDTSAPTPHRQLQGANVQTVRRAMALSGAPVSSMNSQTPRVVARPIPVPHSAPPHSFKSIATSSNQQLRYEFDFADSKKGMDKSKGLRHFSTKVCEKVKEKGRTNYNEVADELVAEYFDSHASIQLNDEKHSYDMKNIRRRVYDALNVLLAMNIIQKNKKDILWVGLPTSTIQEFKRLEEDKIRRQERIREKTENLQEMMIQLVAYKSLVDKNRERERHEGRPVDSSVLYLPYVIVNTEKKALVECSVAHDKSEFLFNFDQPFEIHDDVEVLKRLGLAHGLERGEVVPASAAKVKGCLPPALRDYVDTIMHGNTQMMQCDPQKPVQYVIQPPIDQKPYENKPPPMAPAVRQVQRAPVVVARAVPGSRYVVKQPIVHAHNGSAVQPNPKRYQQVVVRQPNGHGRVVLQAPPSRQVAQQQQMYHHRVVQQHQQQLQQHHYEYQDEDDGGVYDELYDDVEGEENLGYI